MELMDKQGGRHRSSMELLTQMCWEDVPQIDEASLSVAPGASTTSCRYAATHLRSVEDATCPRTRLTIPSCCLLYPEICARQRPPPSNSHRTHVSRPLPDVKDLPARQRRKLEPRRCPARILECSSRHCRSDANTPKAEPVRSTGSRRQKTAGMDSTATTRRMQRKSRQERS